MENAHLQLQYLQVENQQSRLEQANIIVEASVSLTVNGEVWLSWLCTPVDLEALAVGFLFNEGVIQSMNEVASVHLCNTGDIVDIWLHHSAERPQTWRRTSGCTGGLTAVENNQHAVQIEDGSTLNPAQIHNLIKQLFEAQNLYQKTGGVHTSALSDGESIYVVAEDIGRHNTLDKLAGRCLMEKITLPRRVILTTGRISSEMLQKAAHLGSSVVISRTSPTSLSIQMADQLGITLIGYARRSSFRVYTHPERILIPIPQSSILPSKG